MTFTHLRDQRVPLVHSKIHVIRLNFPVWNELESRNWKELSKDKQHATETIPIGPHVLTLTHPNGTSVTRMYEYEYHSTDQIRRTYSTCTHFKKPFRVPTFFWVQVLSEYERANTILKVDFVPLWPLYRIVISFSKKKRKNSFSETKFPKLQICSETPLRYCAKAVCVYSTSPVLVLVRALVQSFGKGRWDFGCGVGITRRQYPVQYITREWASSLEGQKNHQQYTSVFTYVRTYVRYTMPTFPRMPTAK